jgi:hypothetical protein
MDWIAWIKLVHTLVFLIASSCIVYIVYCGLIGKLTSLLWTALWLVLAIGLIYAANGFECPLATLVHQLAGRRDVADIYFPDWFANKIMPVSAAVYVLGVVLVGWRWYRARRSNPR